MSKYQLLMTHGSGKFWEENFHHHELEFLEDLEMNLSKAYIIGDSDDLEALVEFASSWQSKLYSSLFIYDTEDEDIFPYENGINLNHKIQGGRFEIYEVSTGDLIHFAVNRELVGETLSEDATAEVATGGFSKPKATYNSLKEVSEAINNGELWDIGRTNSDLSMPQIAYTMVWDRLLHKSIDGEIEFPYYEAIEDINYDGGFVEESDIRTFKEVLEDMPGYGSPSAGARSLLIEAIDQFVVYRNKEDISETSYLSTIKSAVGEEEAKTQTSTGGIGLLIGEEISEISESFKTLFK